jgi:uncharacterized protein (DUF779 family)
MHRSKRRLQPEFGKTDAETKSYGGRVCRLTRSPSIIPFKEKGRPMVDRVLITDEAVKVVDKLQATHGPLLFHQSGGCCDGSAPMCYPLSDFRVGPQDVLLGNIASCDFYIGAAQFEYWQHTQLIIDVVPGRGFRLLAGGARGRAISHAQPPIQR